MTFSKCEIYAELTYLCCRAGHVPLYSFPDVSTALTFWSEGGSWKSRSKLPNVMLLNGDWKFYLAPSPNDVPSSFHGLNFDDDDWDVIQVPSNWECQGFDRPDIHKPVLSVSHGSTACSSARSVVLCTSQTIITETWRRYQSRRRMEVGSQQDRPQ